MPEQADAVAPLPLGLVQRVVGRGEQLVRGAHARVVGRHAAAHRHVLAVLLACVHRGPDAVREHHRALRVRPGQHAHELLAAEARGQVHPPGRAGQDVREGAQRLVAGLVPVAIVERLEPVQVEEHHRKEAAALRGGELVLQEDARVTAVREVSEDVRERHVLDVVPLLMEPLGQPADPERDRDVRHHDAQEKVGDRPAERRRDRLGDREGGHPGCEGGRHPAPATVVGEQEGRDEGEQPEQGAVLTQALG